MIIDLTDTTASGIAGALVRARRHAGSPAMGMVLTMVVVAEEGTHYDSLSAAAEAAKEHPSRILGVILRPGRTSARLDASVRIGEGSPGETVLLRLYGELAKHPESVVTPLLLPESPVVVWWPGKAPATPSADPIGQLAQRRITDAAGVRRPLTALETHCGGYAPGDTDLTWTRTTPWRALLAAALDQHQAKVVEATVEAERSNASADLLAAWLSKRLHVDTAVKPTRGPGITAVRLQTSSGEIAITRGDGRLARYSLPGQPERHVALKRRDTAELLAEELRRLDPDDIYAHTIEELLHRIARHNGAAPAGSRRSAATPAAKTATKAATKTAKKTARKTATKTVKKTVQKSARTSARTRKSAR